MLRNIFLLFLVSIYPGLLFSVNQQLKYTQNYTISDGLTHNGVTCILEDSKGYIWIGTYDGLNRYDGYDFKTFKNSIDNQKLISNRIRSLFEDSKGNIWIGTDDGITVYDYAQERFFNIYSNKLIDKNKRGPVVRFISENKKQTQIICTTEKEGILVFNTDYAFERKFLPPLSLSENNKDISFFQFLELDDEKLLFSTSIGLLELNKNTAQYRLVQKRLSNFTGFVTDVGEGYILTTFDQGVGLIKYDLINGNYNYNIERVLFNEYMIVSCSVDLGGNLWLGTPAGGIIHVDNIQKVISHNELTLKKYNEQNGVRISSILTTESIGCWVGSFDKGVYRFETQDNPFFYIQSDSKQPLAFKSNHIMGFSALDSTHFFISTLNGGVGLYNIEKKNFVPITFTNAEIKKEDVSSVFVDNEKNIWVQITNKGLYKIEKRTNKAQLLLQSFTNQFLYNIILSYAQDDFGNIWIGGNFGVRRLKSSLNGGVVVEDIVDHNIFLKKRAAVCRRIFYDKEKQLIWIAIGAEGLYRVKIEEDIPLKDLIIDHYVRDVETPNTLSSDFVTSFVCLPNDEFWIGTEGGGICRVENREQEPLFYAFSETDGLSNHAVKNILFDSKSNLWISTNIGINIFNRNEKLFRSFGIQDGLEFEDFNYPSIKMDNGYIVMSGYKGVICFLPEEVKQEDKIPNLEFDVLKVGNSIILPNDTLGGRVLISKRIGEIDRIQLKYDENNISLTLKSLHFSNPRNHFLKYRLFPVTKDWSIVPSNQNVINYNELRAGKYQFQIQTSNSLGEWSEVKELDIIINPPFWKTIYALIFYVFIIGLIILIVFRFRLSILTLKHKLEIEHLEKESKNKVNEARLRYFSNISHEIKTPLTLISGPVNLLEQRLRNNAELNENVQIIQRQSKKITQLIDQVHDFQRSDAEMLKMYYSQFCFDTMIHDLIMDFEFMARNDRKSLEVIGQVNKIFVYADKDKLEKVLNNLLNNAFKYTNPNDKIHVSYKREERDLLIKVTDTGRGISAEDLPHIFERFYQSFSNREAYIGGSGIGLAFSKRLVDMHLGTISAISELGKGTSIIVKLPIVINQATEDFESRTKEILEAEKETAITPPPEVVTEIKGDESLKNMKVFFVEDNSDMRSFVSGVLTKIFEVKVFTNGLECLTAMEDEWPDILVSDVLMPEMNGFELCKTIKSQIKTSHIPVVLLTACTTIEEQIKGLKEGADAYITKPFNMQHLVSTIESILKNRQHLRERFQLNFSLALELDRKNEESNQIDDDVFLEKLYSLMSENIDNQELELDKIARQLYMNRTHFYQKVKALTNQTPFELLKSFRLAKAAELLVQKNVSVNDVYVMTGFKSRTHFTKLFKEKYNETPGKYAALMMKKMLNK